MTLLLILVFAAIILGFVGFGITSAATHIAKFLFYVVVFLLIILFIIGYFAAHPNPEPISPPVVNKPS